jgi:hypothetical protein
VREKTAAAKNTINNLSTPIVILGLLALVVVLFICRNVAPALTMGLVHLITINSFIIFWVAVYVLLILLLLKRKGFVQKLGLMSVIIYAVCHAIVANSLGDYALYLDYAAGNKISPLPTPSIESAKFLPKNVAKSRLQATGDSTQLEMGSIDEAVILTKEGQSHTAFATTYVPRDYETKISGQTKIAYIDAHTGALAQKKAKLQIFPGGTFGFDPMRAFYASLSMFDGTSQNSGNEIIPIINQKDDSLLYAMPVTTPKTVLVGIFPISNIPTYSGAVIINPVTGQYGYKTVSEIEKDPILSHARLFPIALAKEVAHASRFVGVEGIVDLVRTLLKKVQLGHLSMFLLS